MAFSDTWLRANNGKERAALEERGDREGLGVRITPKGKITFQIRYRYQGKPRRLDVVSQDVVPVEAEAGGWRSVRGRGVWAVEVVVVHPRLQLSGSVL